jgi:hypothetical protein
MTRAEKANKVLKALEFHYNIFSPDYDFHNSDSLDEFLLWYDCCLCDIKRATIKHIENIKQERRGK